MQACRLHLFSLLLCVEYTVTTVSSTPKVFRQIHIKQVTVDKNQIAMLTLFNTDTSQMLKQISNNNALPYRFANQNPVLNTRGVTNCLETEIITRNISKITSYPCSVGSEAEYVKGK